MVAAILRVRLLGAPDLRLGGAALPPLESARAPSLLAYLLLHREAAQPRRRLAFLLWPDSTEAQARTNSATCSTPSAAPSPAWTATWR